MVMAWFYVFLNLFFALEKYLPRKGFTCEVLSEKDLMRELHSNIAVFTLLLPGSREESLCSVTESTYLCCSLGEGREGWL